MKISPKKQDLYNNLIENVFYLYINALTSFRAVHYWVWVWLIWYLNYNSKLGFSSKNPRERKPKRRAAFLPRRFISLSSEYLIPRHNHSSASRNSNPQDQDPTAIQILISIDTWHSCITNKNSSTVRNSFVACLSWPYKLLSLVFSDFPNNSHKAKIPFH